MAYKWSPKIMTYLVLLVLGDNVRYVTLGFVEFHLVHTFTSVQMEEDLGLHIVSIDIQVGVKVEIKIEKLDWRITMEYS